LPHFITQSSFSFLIATLHHPVFLFLSLCHNLFEVGASRERRVSEWAIFQLYHDDNFQWDDRLLVDFLYLSNLEGVSDWLIYHMTHQGSQ
jgi:hypothetical protein